MKYIGKYLSGEILLTRECILYKYILLVRVICEKYRLRGEANIPSGEEAVRFKAARDI
jgi:hypothetical protein